MSNGIGNGSRDKLNWLCQYGHTWKMTYDAFSAGSWCPRCIGYVGELTTRIAMEGLFGVPFPRQRPIFLSVGARSRLELDGYNEDLKIAFEHHGLQHYQSIRHFTSQPKSVALRDRLKRKLCGRRGVRLIEVPQVGRMTPVHQLVPLIIAQAEKLGVQQHIAAPAFSLESSDAYKRLRNPFAVQAVALSSRHKRNRLEALRAVAKHHRAKLLTREYFGSQGYYRFKCAKGHKLVLSYRQIRE